MTPYSKSEIHFQGPSCFVLLMEEILHQLIGSLSYDLQGLIHPRWCRISSINSIYLKFRGCMCFSLCVSFNLYLKRSSLFEKNPSKCPQVLLVPKSTSEIAFLRRQEDKIRDVNFELPFETKSTIKRKNDVSMFSCCKQLELQ